MSEIDWRFDSRRLAPCSTTPSSARRDRHSRPSGRYLDATIGDFAGATPSASRRYCTSLAR